MKNHRGFTAIEGLLILIIIGLIGFTGWYAWDAHQKANNALNTANSVATAPVSVKKQPAASTKINYLVIKEWGVKIPESPSGNTISYQISQTNLADFVSSEQKALGGSCGEFNEARFHVLREANGQKPTDENLQNEINNAVANNLDIKIGGYTYYIIGDMSGGDCTGTAKAGSAVSAQETTANNNLKDDLKGMVSAT